MSFEKRLELILEGWTEDGWFPDEEERLDATPPGMSWLLTFSSKNFGSREEAIEYARHCFGIDLSDGRQHETRFKDCTLLVQLEHNI
jgi:hypothetical protein